MTRAAPLPVYPPGHPAFAGHFPGRPIVPGVLLLDAALHAICAEHDLRPDACQLAVVKFFRPVSPGGSLELSHAADPQGQVRFTVQSVSDLTPVATGQVLCQTSRSEP